MTESAGNRVLMAFTSASTSVIFVLIYYSVLVLVLKILFTFSLVTDYRFRFR